ncbi:solute:sodium symporter family transporter [Candidatus Epulonipiscium fishelsonii]|uniref:Solute:sodium symporter family transporter n=1 Tax=Candidatus Epulonipiscium fishelsonii TaxID=77094 RepID=A0ACC8XGM5_9FIRM|nr:solute:sodium symporter family transporter [Epulopiscium sp. SCG-B05WGA-EpuloA1]ONI42715.1 solute:sodium symporter family transporter [Epulopiscium sp. SCG-B11WGA-EpuloA1]
MILISFVVFSGIVGLITYLKTKGDTLESSEGYFLGGRSLTGGVIAGSLLLTNLSAASFVGMSGQAYEANMSVMGWEVGSGITLILVALFLVPRYLKQGITTIPEFIQSRFDGGTRQFITILFLVSYIINLLPITLYSGAVAMGQIFNVSEIFGITYVQSIWVMVWIIGIIGSIYAIFGGLKAVAISDTINGIALVIGGLLVPIFGILFIGDGNFVQGLTSFFQSNPEKFNAIGSSTDPLPFSTMFTGLLLVNLYYWGTDQSIIQRALGAKNLEEAQKGVIFAGLLKVLTPMLVIIPGIIAFQILGSNITNMDTVYPLLVSTVLPAPIIGLFAAAMMGAILSTFNSVLNSASTLFALNVYKTSIGKDASEKQLIKVGKLFALVIALVSMFVAPFILNAPAGLFDYLQTINGFFNVPIFTIIFMGYMTKRVPPIAAKVAITFFVTVYGITQLFIDTGIHYLHISGILFVISCLMMFVIGKIRPMEVPYKMPENSPVEMNPWKERYLFSGAVMFVMISMYIVFSKYGIAKAEGFTMDTLLYIIGVGAVCAVCSIVADKKFNAPEKQIEAVEAEEVPAN